MSEHRFAEKILARNQALELLFQTDAIGRSIEDILDGSYLITDGPLEDYAVELARGAGSMFEELDGVIELVSDNWSVSRMSSVDRCILRLAAYEMLVVDEVDVSVSISEAVELAKKYGTDESSRFVNGILGNIARRMEEGEDLFALARDAAADSEDGEA